MITMQQVRTGKQTSLWLAFACALGLHLLILLIPVSQNQPSLDDHPVLLELQLTTAVVPAPAQEPVEILEEIVVPDRIPEPDESIADSIPLLPPAVEPTPLRPAEVNIEPIIDQKQRRLSRAILSARLPPEVSEADKIFGVQIAPPEQPNYAEFNRPIGRNMMSMLDQPMQELPFAYTPGLVRFAYDPGVKGDLQRFWDVITPEFGWRTDNGTEFKCVLVLIIVGCGWK